METNEILVISQFMRKDIFLGNIEEYHYYKMFFSQHKKLICNCPHGIYEDSFCSHRKELIKLVFNMRDPRPIVSIEFQKLIYHEILCSRTPKDIEDFSIAQAIPIPPARPGEVHLLSGPCMEDETAEPHNA